MGRCSFSRVGYGMTQQEAYRDAMEQADRESGHREGYSGDMNSACDDDMKVKCIKKPNPAKRCKIEKTVQKGARKWETIFYIEPRFGQSSIGSCSTKSQTEAIKKAKEMALKSGETMQIIIEKRLVNSSNRVAIVKPNNSERGAWRFSGTARC